MPGTAWEQALVFDVSVRNDAGVNTTGLYRDGV